MTSPRKIGIIGAGGFGREVHQLLDQINRQSPTWELCGFFDNTLAAGARVNGLPVLGGNAEALDHPEIDDFAIAIGDPLALARIGGELQAQGKRLPNLVHPAVDLDLAYNRIGHGNICTFGFHLTRNVAIGDLNIFNTRVTVGHDAVIGSCNVLLPNVQISGHVRIGDGNVFGMNSSVLQGRKIGSHNRIGAHSFVVGRIGDGESHFGIPATRLFSKEA